MFKIKKKEIINTAIDLFAEKGVGKVFIDDIADALGASKGKIYHYFQNKSEIISAILQQFETYISTCVPDPKEWESQNADAEKILFKLFFQFPEGDMLRYRKIVHIIISGMHDDEQLKDYAVDYFIKGRESTLAACFSALRENGKIVSLPLEPISAARFFNSYLVVCAMLDSSRYPYIDDEAKADALQEQVVRDCTGFLNLLLEK